MYPEDMDEKPETRRVEIETPQEENLVAFFTLLMEIDKRVNPENYAQSND